MSNYTKSTNFTAKDSLPTGDTNKVIRGSEFDTEFNAISVAVATKSDLAGPTFTGTATFADLTGTGTINFTGATVSNLGTVTTVDINGGTIDGVTIGGSSAGAGTFSSLTATTADINGGTVDGVTIGGSSAGAGTFSSLTATTADINAGTVDNTVIGGTTPAAGTFSSLTATTANIDGGSIDGAVIGGSTPAAISGTTGTFSGAVSGTTGTFSGAVTGSNLNISNWDTAFGWGDHSTEGYLTSVTFSDMDAGAITTSGETFANSDTQIPTNAAVRNWVLTTYPTIVELNDLTANVTWATVPDAYISESSVTQHVTIEKATQSKTYTNGETSTLTLSESITSGVPVVSVTKEVAQTGLTNNNWDVATDGTNYDLEDSAYATTLTPSVADADGTFTLGSGSFAADDVGKIVSGNGGTAIILNTSGDYNLLTSFTDTSAIASGSWTLKEMVVDGANTGFALASGTETVSSFVYSLGALAATGNETFAFTSAPEIQQPEAVRFNSDGTKMYVLCSQFDDIFEFDLSTAFDVSTATYNSVFFAINSQEGAGRDFVFNNDGTKFYLIGTGSDTVYQYSCSTAYSLSTASYDSVSFSVSTQTANPMGLSFNTDGTVMLVADGNGKIHEYALSTGFNVSTASHTRSNGSALPGVTYFHSLTVSNDGTEIYIGQDVAGVISLVKFNLAGAWDTTTIDYAGVFTLIASGGSGARAFCFNNEGNKLFYADDTSFAQKIVEYSINPVYNMNAMDYSGNAFNVGSQDTSPYGVRFNEDGTKMFVLGSGNDTVFQYSLTTGFDVTTASYDSVSFSVASEDATPTGIFFNADGTKLYVSGNTADSIFQYNLSTAFDLSTASYASKSFSVATQDLSPQGAAFNNDGTKLYVVGSTNDSVFQYSLSTADDISTASYDSVSFNVNTAVGEATPRDITFNADGTRMYIVGSGGDDIYQFELSTAFDLSTASSNGVEINLSGEENNPVSLTFNNDGTKVFIIGYSNDRVREYSIYNLKNAEYSGKSLDYSATDTKPNGIRFNADGTKMYILGQTNATITQFSLSTAYDITTGTADGATVSTMSPVARDSNPSDFVFSPGGTLLFILGYGYDKVYKYTLSTAFDLSTATYDSDSGSIISSYESQPYALAFNSDGTKMYTAGLTSKDVDEYSLGTAYNLSTLTYLGTRAMDGTGLSMNSVTGIGFNDDGSRFYTFGTDRNISGDPSVLVVHDVPTDFTVTSSITEVAKYYVENLTGDPRGFGFSKDFSKIYTMGHDNQIIHQHDLGANITQTDVVYSSDYAVAVTNSSGQVDSTYFTDINSTTTTESVGTGEAYYAYSVDNHVTWKVIHNTNGERSIVRNNSGTWEYNSNTTYASTTWTSATTNSEVGALKQAMEGSTTTTGYYDVSGASFVDSFSVSSQETAPQDITFNTDGTKMYVVGSSGDDVNEYTLSTGFDISTASYSQNFSVSAQDTGPLGIAFNTDGTKMFICGSAGQDVNEYNLSTGFDVSTASYSQNFSVAAEEGTPTGIAFNTDGTKMFICGTVGDDVNEYTLSTGFDVSTASYSQNFSVATEDSLPQGITFNSDGTKMYIIGQTGDDVNEYNLSTGFDVSTASYSQVFSIASENTNPKGLAFNSDGSKMFVIGQSPTSVHEYTLTTTSYPNQMTGTQFDAVTDANHLTLSTTMDFMIALKNADSTSTSPTSDGVAFNYDAQSLQQGAVLGTDYNWDFPALNKVRITSLADQNLKVRII